MEEKDLVKMGIVKVGKIDETNLDSPKKVANAVWNISTTILLVIIVVIGLVIGTTIIWGTTLNW